MPCYLAVIVTLLLIVLFLFKGIYTWYLFLAILVGVLSHLRKTSKIKGKWILNRKKFIDYLVIVILGFIIIAIVLTAKRCSLSYTIPYIIMFFIAIILCFLLAMEKEG